MMRAMFLLSAALTIVTAGPARSIEPNPCHVRPYSVLREEPAERVDERSARRWIITSDSDTRDEFAHTAMWAVLDLHRQFGADHTKVLLVATEALGRAGVIYASASYATDSLGSKGPHNGIDTRFRYGWFVRVAEHTRAVADSLGIEPEEIKAPYLFTPLYYDDIREGRPANIR